ncbi:MAG: hypothetical protein M2R45_05043 [Verrucomicrobia subdivision 3 bacterium]|nr:hypothetical protein [Limisphaerales bacterium]MCS1412555.1 hypothetical protein [Limisphaerales bacterium]
MRWPTTKLQDLLGVRHPIIQSPIGGATSPEMTAVVSNTDGFGMVNSVSATPERLRATIQSAKERTSAPFGVNMMFKDNVEHLIDTALDEQAHAVSFF